MKSFFFMAFPEISTKREVLRKQPQDLTPISDEEAARIFNYVYGNNDRRDDGYRTKKELSEKYGIDFI